MANKITPLAAMQIHHMEIAAKLRQMQQQLKAQHKNSAIQENAGKLAVNQQRAIALKAGTEKPDSRLLRRRDLLQ